MGRWTPRAAPVRNSRHRGHPAPLREDYNVVIRSASWAGEPAAARTLTAMGRALVLNATELPLAVVPARRAVVLVLKEKAEVVQSKRAVLYQQAQDQPEEFWGALADRYGRRLPLMLDLVFYSIVEVLSGLAPDYSTFLVLRERRDGGGWHQRKASNPR